MKPTLKETAWMILINGSSITPVTESKIKGFTDLAHGWCYGRGIKFTEEVINNAIDINRLANHYGFYETDAFPGERGDIMVTVYKNDWYCEIMCHKNNRYGFISEFQDDEMEYKENIELEAVNESLKNFRRQVVCNLSEYSTQSSLIQGRKDLSALPSKTQVITAEYRLSARNASSKVPDAFANISKNFTSVYQELPSCFGSFKQIAYRQIRL